ncbi:MAG: hypothetical protein A4E55_00226 [Pelotomaculum sp. PtaU1.Bin035]|nr:MAG: hypothetical protein A4E55_00226 [Pelotomaculum sp. PtaU1.Bin035]
MKCPSCNTDDLTGLYCSNCGAKLPVNQEQEIPENDSLNNKPIEQELENLTEQFAGINSDNKKKQPKLNKLIFISVGIIVLLTIIISIQNHNKNEAEYQKGIELKSNENWEESAKIFLDLKNKGYRDSNIHYAEIKQILSYQKSIQLIKDKKWKEAATELVSLQQENYKDSKVLYSYVSAEQQYLADFLGTAIIENNIAHLKPVQTKLNEISTDYSGLFAQDINNFRNDIEKQLQSLQTRLAESKKKTESVSSKTQGVRIGMTQQEVLNSSWGKPKSVNKTTTQYGIHEQWVYGNNNYLYFEDGILTTIQN